MDSMKISPAGRHFRRRRGSSHTQRRRPVELPRLAHQKGCFAAYDIRSIDELSGRTTDRLRYIRLATANAIGGTAELALPYSFISASTARPRLTQPPVATTSRTQMLEHGQRRRIRWGRRTVSGTTGRPEQRTPPPIPPGPQDLPGTTGRTELRTDRAGVHRGTRTTRPRDLPEAGRRVSPMHGTRSQATRLLANIRRGPGRVPFSIFDAKIVLR
jgi:hypothetical protein